MEPVIGLNCPQTIEYPSPSTNAPIWQDILAQAMTGELAAMNYTSLSEICDDPEEVRRGMESISHRFITPMDPCGNRLDRSKA